MSNNIELLSTTENFTIGTNSNLSQILANVVKVGTDTSNVTISIPQDISSSYNLILPVRQGASGESLVYGADGQLKWDDPTVLKQVVSVFGSNLGSDKVDVGEMSSVSFPTNYQASITPLSANTKIFVQFKINYKAALSSDNQVDFYIYKHINGSQTPDKIFSETMYGPYIGTGGFVGQYISNLIDEPNTTDEITYKLGYKVNGTVDISDTLGILGYDVSYNNTIVLQEFEGSGVYAASVWNKGADSNGLYYNDGTVHIGSTKDALGSQNTPGVALELSGNLVGTSATFSGNIYAHAFIVEEAHIGPNTLFINGTRVLNQNDNGSVNVYTDQIISDASNGLTIKATGDNGSIILDPSGTGSIQLNGDVVLSGGNINAETFIGDLSGNVSAITMTATTTTTTHLNLNGNLVTSSSSYVEGNLIPSEDDTYTLGTQTKVWKDLYLGPGSLYINNKKVIEENDSTINITTDENQNLAIKTSGAGVLQLNSETGGIYFNTSNGGTIKFNSDIVLQGNISMTNTGTNVPINLNDDVYVKDNLDVGGNLKVNKINREDLGYVGLYLEEVIVNGSSITGNVTGTVSSLSNHTTTNLDEGSNLYFTTERVRSNVSGGTGINYSESTGVFSIGQSVGITDNVRFNNVTVEGTLNSDDITGSNVTVSNDLVVSGNLTVNGTRTIVNATTLDIGDNKIVVNAAGSTTDAGIIANVSGTEHEFVYSTNNNAWGTTGDLNIGGNVTGTTFIGDGSQLTGITDTTYTAGDGLSLDGTTFNNTAPDQTVTISGSGATTVTGTYPNFTITSTDTNTTYTAGTGLSLDGTTFNIPQSVGTSDNVQFNNVTATTFIGDGSQLTNISAGANLTNNSDASFGSVDINNTLTIIDNNNNNISYQQIGSDIYGEANEDKSGWSVSLNNDGTIVAIGAPYNDGNGGNSGHVRVYQYSNSSWTQLGNDIDGETSNNFIGYGTSISLSSDGLRIAIGSFYNTGSGNRSGHVRVFEYNTGTTLWTQLGSDIDGEAELDQSGIAVSLSSDGTIVAIGATGNDGGGANSGHVRVYQYSNSSWTQLGSDIDGEAAGDNLGNEGTVSLSSDGTILAIGGVSNDGNNGVDSGHVRVYQYSNSSWTQLGSDIDGEAAFDYSGRVSLSSDGTIVAIGAPYNDSNGSDSGHVRVYQYSNSSWTQLGNTMYGDAVNDHFGFRVALSEDGNTLIVGNIEFYSSNTGYAKIFKYISGSWTQIGSNIYGKASADKFSLGLAISKNGSVVAIGAPYNDDSGSNVGVVQVYELIQQDNIEIINGNISGVNTITASSFIGDGSQLTGITDTTYTAGTGVTIDSSNVISISNVDATKIADGSVSNTEFQYLNGVTSSIETQFRQGTSFGNDYSGSGSQYFGTSIEISNGSGDPDFTNISDTAVSLHGGYNGANLFSGSAGFRVRNSIIYAYGSVDGNNVLSDDRYKSRTVDMGDALTRVKQIRVREFQEHPFLRVPEGVEDTDLTGVEHYYKVGVVAQELEQIVGLGYLVRESPDGIVNGDNNPTKSVNYGAINIYLLRAVQQLSDIIDAQETRIAVLEAAISNP